MKIKFILKFIFIDLDNNVDQEAAEQEKKELIESLIVKTKMEEQEVFLSLFLFYHRNFHSAHPTDGNIHLSFDDLHHCQLLLAYDEFYAKYPEGEINQEQFMEVSKVQLILF